jgi:hypothetical protein
VYALVVTSPPSQDGRITEVPVVGLVDINDTVAPTFVAVVNVLVIVGFMFDVYPVDKTLNNKLILTTVPAGNGVGDTVTDQVVVLEDELLLLII